MNVGGGHDSDTDPNQDVVEETDIDDLAQVC